MEEQKGGNKLEFRTSFNRPGNYTVFVCVCVSRLV